MDSVLREANRRVRRLGGKIGFRGLGLLAFACVCFGYGSALLLGYHPIFHSALHLSTMTYGWIFIGFGFFSLTGVLSSRDMYHYAICALGVCAWVLLIATHWAAPYGWGASVSWMGVAGALIIAAAWPEPVHKHDDPPPLEETDPTEDAL